jgi:tetratricopeptide (TPR) repeat protein
VHESVKQAWFLVETGYFVVQEKYAEANRLLGSDDPAQQARGDEMKSQVTQEVQQNIFGVNDSIEHLFLDAIEQQPDNPLNHASYAFYLKPRRRFDAAGGFTDCEAEARRQIDKAIELWPDCAAFYMQKIHILTAEQRCHTWFRGNAGEDLALASRVEEVRGLFDKAERYDPNNAYINYANAITLTGLALEGLFPGIRDEVLREIKAGNAKPYGHFMFPPPLDTYPAYQGLVKITGNETSAVYYDHWTFNGRFSNADVQTMLMGLLAPLSWPEDKDTVEELMFMLYQLGRLEPPHRSYFTYQIAVVQTLQTQAPNGSEARLQMASLSRFLTKQYKELADYYYEIGLIESPQNVDVNGLTSVEASVERRLAEIERFQKRQGAYLKKAEELVGAEFPNLPDDPEEW